ncbi:MAG: CRTAC1 family protein [Thiobacillaceae bacterium]|nr:CRTAC1 family protein [Thiobacillaceae bacterium]
MSRRLILRLFLLLGLAAAAVVLLSMRHDLQAWFERARSGEGRWFEALDFPYRHMTYLYDLGVVDVNGDGQLDLYTSNHNYRQHLLLADGHGGYREALDAWGLGQDPRLPGFEQNRDPPRMARPGLYIFWQGDVLHLVAHRTAGWSPLRGRLKFYNRVEPVGETAWRTRFSAHVPPDAAVPITQVEFEATGEGRLRLYPHTRGTPVEVTLDAPWLAGKVYVGADAYAPELPQFTLDAPACRWCRRLELSTRDRHAMLWADFDGDGRMDLYINRGALGGMLRRFPPEVRTRIADEFLFGTPTGGFVDRAHELGLKKNDCSGRQARWVDFDRDGRLDLFVNCQDRGRAGGGFPKQLYRQLPDGRLQEVAAQVGLDLPQQQIVDMVWFDTDGDGSSELLTHEDTGFYLYRYTAGRFTRQRLGRGPFHRADVPGLRYEATDYWQFDGKLSVADYDADGDLDAFMTSKRGNVLLNNDGGRLRLLSPERVGLPAASVACAWVDYDNDGHVDMHCVPQGILRANGSGRFERTGMLRLLDQKYQAAIVQWYDRDGDGRLDLLLALQDNASLWRWWERWFKHADPKGRDDRFVWRILSYRNIGPAGPGLQLDLVGGRGNAQAIGARITAFWPGGRTLTHEVGAHEAAYSSQGHYRVYLGLGASVPTHLRLRWPAGPIQDIAVQGLGPRIVLRAPETVTGDR